ncbi:helix-turn-helix domain-containing protein [Terrilactibacillus sp. S3-3]|nr:helix-turn-helix domain-containing protein [Terrilactibacillus sp. S3-3]
MLVNKAYKFRIFPNKKQVGLINKTIGCSRFVFNFFLGSSRKKKKMPTGRLSKKWFKTARFQLTLGKENASTNMKQSKPFLNPRATLLF